MLSQEVRALAQADFSAIAPRFAAAGFEVLEPAKGMLSIVRDDGLPRPALLISVGVHGDETGPIELVAHLLSDLSQRPRELAADLMVVIGSVDAIAAGKRFIEADLNRMFKDQRGDLAGLFEAGRADVIMQHTRAFFEHAGPVRWHLDLHTAIRPSVYPMFAIVPDLIEPNARNGLISWLGQAGIEAVIMNPQSAGTYSYWTSENFGAAGSTVELGKVGVLGQNDLSQFAATRVALDALLCGDTAPAAANAPLVFRIAQQITKLSAAFTMAFDKSTQNFTPMRQGETIATDGGTVYTVRETEELVVFPNPDVRIGQRAGLMVVRVS
ncbi:MAG TPA: succinylglutamate desuccinylase [Burkholderiaceae bacterium]